MKVLHIVKTNKGATWAFNQSKKLKEYGLEIVTVIPKEEGTMNQNYKKIGIKVIEEDFSLPIKKPWKIFQKIKKINEIVKLEKPDVIHTHFVTNILMLRIALRKDKTIRIFQVPGPLHLENHFFKWLDIMLSQKNDYWIATCKKTYEIYRQEKISNDRIFLSYYGNGENIKYLEPKNKLRKEFKLSDKDILIGIISYFYKPKRYLGQTRGLKGHEDFIDSISILSKKNPNIKGIIIGGPWGNAVNYQKKLKKYAKKVCKDNIIFTGFRSDLIEIYKELDIAVHPSYSENLGGAAESLAAGVPTIATNIGGFKDVIIDGQTGYLCEVSNPKSIVENVKKILNNKNKTIEMTINAQNMIKELLDINNTSKKVFEIYNEILEKTKE